LVITEVNEAENGAGVQYYERINWLTIKTMLHRICALNCVHYEMNIDRNLSGSYQNAKH